MAKSQIRVGIVGCGRAAGLDAVLQTGAPVSHIQAIREDTRLLIVAAFDTDPRQLQKFCSRWGVQAESSWESLIAQRLDCLLISTPTETHGEYLRKAVTCDLRFVVCEKPLAQSATEACEIVELFRARKMSLAAYYPRVWISDIRDIGDRIAREELGQPESIHVYYGNGLRNIGCHAINLIHRLLGPISDVWALPGRERSKNSDDPTRSVWFRLSTGETGIMQAYDYSNYALFELDILFQRGRIRLTDLGFSFATYERRQSENYANFHELRLRGENRTDYAEAALNFWRDVADTICSDRLVIESEDVSVLRVVDAAIRSCVTGERIATNVGH
jgi:predicted dehydrogenase